MSDLVAKLRYLADCGQDELGSVPVPLLQEAADEIDRYFRWVDDLQAELDTAAANLRELEQEIAGYRK